MEHKTLTDSKEYNVDKGKLNLIFRMCSPHFTL